MRITGACMIIMTGCIERHVTVVEVGDLEKYVTVTEAFVQRPLPALDLLFVVDDTSSMKGAQESLALEFFQLADTLDALDVRWQAGVVTMDGDAEKAGWLQGDPWVVTGSMDGAPEILSDHLQVGTSGVADEAGFAVAVKALDLAREGGPNASFRRPDATLMVVFVSNADDQSDSWFEEDPGDAFLVRLDEETSSYGVPATVSAVVGDAPTGCASKVGWVPAGHRYLTAQNATSGGFASICSGDLSAFWDGLVLGGDWYSSTFFLANSPADGMPVAVRVNDQAVKDGWKLFNGPARIVFDNPPPASANIAVEYAVENLQ